MAPSAPQTLTRSPASSYIDQFESLKQARSDFDRKWQLVSDYILPRRDFTVQTRLPNQLRPHRVTSSVATNANTRLAALLLAYLVDPTRPFLLPNVKKGLVVAGRDTELQSEGLDYLGGLEWQLFDHMMLPKAQLMLRLGSMLKEFCAFGCGVIWTGRRRGFGPYFNARPVQACWWSENEEGEIDTLYFRMMLPLHRVFARWPSAKGPGGWGDSAGKDLSEQELTPILLAVRPRPGGRYGAVADAKPFSYCAVAEEKALILEESGYDSFPYAVFRYDPMPGVAYAEGPGCQVLPDVMVLNHLRQAIENAASQKATPPLAMPARMFGRVLDRRPGATNIYNPAGLGIQRADQAIIKLDFTGDVSGAREFCTDLTNDIELGYMTDWLRLRESGDMTAEEVGERRDMRLRGMSSIVANCEAPMGVIGDRSLDVMKAEGFIAPPPAQLGGVNVDWEYAGPLAVAQLRGNVQAVLQLLNARGVVAGQDPAAAQAVDLEEGLRVIAEGLATPTRLMVSRQKVDQLRQQMAQRQQQQEDAQKLATVAGAANDGAQGISALAGAANQGQAAGGGGAAPFAPVAPFAGPFQQPVAA